MHKKVILFSLLGVLICTSSALAQLNQTFQRIFDQILRVSVRMSPGLHGQHYFAAANEANMVLAPTLNTLIASNVRLFTSTSTIAGITFDWSSGNPVSINESLGPILAETAETFGKGQLNIGFEYTYLNLAEFRGLATQDIRFSFIHEDVNNNGVIGDDPFESDFIDLTLGMDVNASIFALFATVGLTNNIDVGLAVPFVKVNLSGEANAVISGPTVGSVHFFGTSVNNSTSTTLSYDESATGLGDITVRLKYNFVRAPGINLATLLDVGLPTGGEEDLLGTGKIVTKFSLIGSRKLAQFTPHFNIGYERRPAELDSDELKFIIGFDQKMAEG